jgi:hypothetical protein
LVEGTDDGSLLGRIDGIDDGTLLGIKVGMVEGLNEGNEEGSMVGLVGTKVGKSEGAEGATVGVSEGGPEMQVNRPVATQAGYTQAVSKLNGVTPNLIPEQFCTTAICKELQL